MLLSRKVFLWPVNVWTWTGKMLSHIKVHAESEISWIRGNVPLISRMFLARWKKVNFPGCGHNRIAFAVSDLTAPGLQRKFTRLVKAILAQREEAEAKKAALLLGKRFQARVVAYSGLALFAFGIYYLITGT